MSKKPIYEIIVDYLNNLELDDGGILTLGNDFVLPKEKKEGLSFADGAWDGISIYHMGGAKITEEDLSEIASAVRIASDGDYDKADIAFQKVCNRISVVNFIDEMQHFIVTHTGELSASNLYGYAIHVMTGSSDAESIKAGMMILELFNLDDTAKQIVRLLGLSDEFTLYSVFLMRQWENGNSEILNLAKAVHGWGRIHAVHYIEPETEEIKYWLLTEGVLNYVVPAYSGLDCYKKADVESVLDKKSLTYEELKGILSIIDALLDEGPVEGISEIENPENLLVKVLKHARKHLPLQAEEADVINNISHWQEMNGCDDNPDIEVLVEAILCDSETRENVMEEVAKGRFINLANGMGLPYKEELFTAMTNDFETLYSDCGWLMDDEYADKVLELFRKNMNLKDLQMDPSDSLGVSNPTASKLDFIVQELKNRLGVGEDFIEAALKSPVIRNRNGALNVLESWIKDRESPLAEVCPQVYQLIARLVDTETDEEVCKRMQDLLSGKTRFEEE